MDSLFTVDFFRQNRERLRKLFTGTAPIVIASNGQLQRNSDSTYPFKQDGNFWYMTGLDLPDAVLVMDKAKEYIILPELSEYQETFDDGLTAEYLYSRSGIEMVMNAKDGWKQLSNRITKVKHVATVAASPPYVHIYGMYTNPARAVLAAKIKEINSAIELLDLSQHFAKMRMVKQAPELAAIKKAINLTAGSLKYVEKKLAKGVYDFEYQIEADITKRFISAGHNNAWKPIVGAGKNATTLHHYKNDGPIQKGDLVVIDIGAEVENYAADLTRTYAASEPNKRQQQVYDAVKTVQEYAFSLLRPGVTIRENEQKVQTFMGEKLRELGLIKTIDTENVRRYFTHATSHYLGLDAHDAGDYDARLVPGVVLTVEPGIYLPQEQLGIRIEDDVLVTKNGITILSKHLPAVLK
jgi:Xaa-Pro aminopeptidase